ncbi:MAG TPA: hypothetical protein VI036_03985 [Propionibacteriaceae bacterium]
MLETLSLTVSRQAELLADLAVGPAVGDPGQDAPLLRREAGQLLVAEQVLALAQAVKAEERGWLPMPADPTPPREFSTSVDSS